jgi:hypothetical protein
MRIMALSKANPKDDGTSKNTKTMPCGQLTWVMVRPTGFEPVTYRFWGNQIIDAPRIFSSQAN